MFSITDASSLTFFTLLIACLSIFMVWKSLIKDDKRDKTKKTIEQYKVALSKKRLNNEIEDETKFRRKSGGKFEQFVGRFQKYNKQRVEDTHFFLIKAGIRENDAVFVYFAAKIIMPIVFGLIGFFIGLQLFSGDTLFMLMAVIIMVFIGYSGVETYIKRKIKSRYHAIYKGIPDFLDLFIVCSEAGLTPQIAFKRIAADFAGAHPELADEIGLTVVEMSFYPDQEEPLGNLASRVDLSAMRSVTAVLQHSLRFGSPLTVSLKNLAAELRTERILKVEAKAARLPAMLTVPLILFILPTLFMVILGPSIIQISDVFK